MENHIAFTSLMLDTLLLLRIFRLLNNYRFLDDVATREVGSAIAMLMVAFDTIIELAGRE